MGALNSVQDLFPSNGVNFQLNTATGHELEISVCQSCGAMVGRYSQTRHTRWHNDLTPWTTKLDPNEQE